MSSVGVHDRDRAETTRPRRRRPSLIIELAVIVLGYFAYSAIRVAARGEESIAARNAHWLINLERKLHLDPEQWLNGILNAHHLPAQIAGYYYASMHFAVTPIVLIWLYWRHPYHYRWGRTTLFVMTISSLLVFWSFPVAPPRFAEAHITDTLAVYKILELAAPRAGQNTVANLNAAMPSLHVGWAAWCALAVWVVFRRKHRIWALTAWIYPLLTFIVVLGTGNHYLVDGIGGLLALGAGFGVATLTMRWREVQEWMHEMASRWRAGPLGAPGAQTLFSKAAESKVSVSSAPSASSPIEDGDSNESPAPRPVPSSER